MLVIALATIVNVGYGAIFCAFSVLLGACVLTARAAKDAKSSR